MVLRIYTRSCQKGYVLGVVEGTDIQLGYANSKSEPVVGSQMPILSSGVYQVTFTISRFYFSDSNQKDLFIALFSTQTSFSLEGTIYDNRGNEVTGSTLQIMGCKILKYRPIMGNANDIIGEEASGYGTNWNLSGSHINPYPPFVPKTSGYGLDVKLYISPRCLIDAVLVPVEYIVNGGFEIGTHPPWNVSYGWTLGAGSSVSVALPHSGVYGIFLWDPFGAGGTITQTIPNAPVDAIKHLTFWARGYDATTPVFMKVTYSDSSSDIHEFWFTTTYSQADMKPYLTAGKVITQIQIYVANAFNQWFAYLDDVSMRTV